MRTVMRNVDSIHSRSSGAGALRVAGISLLVWLSAVLASAQYRAGIQGIVTDPSSARVPEATVTLVNKETGLVRTTTTSGTGVFAITGLVPGPYLLTVEKEGFKAGVVEDVAVQAEQMESVNVALELGATKDSVTVSAEAVPDLETSGGTIGGTITAREVESLPAYNRDPLRLALLASGTFGDNARAGLGGARNLPGNAGPGGTGDQSLFQTENQVQVSAGGLRPSANSIQVDGVSTDSLTWGGATTITPNSESVRQIRIDASSYSAESSRAGGAQIQVVSKHGTNEYHGSWLWHGGRPNWNGVQDWNGPTAEVQRVPDDFDQWAGSVGGPVVRNKLFFFFSYERKASDSANPGISWFETQEYRDLVQAENPNSVAASVLGFPGMEPTFTSVAENANCTFANISPCADIRDGAGNLVGLDIGSPIDAPLGTQAGTLAGGGLDGVPDLVQLNTVETVDRTAQQFNWRGDFQATKTDLIAATTFLTPVDTEVDTLRSANSFVQDRLNWAQTALWNQTLSRNVLNEARFNVSRWSWDELGDNPQVPWGLPQIDIDAMGGADINGAADPGSRAASAFSQTTFAFRNTTSWSHGSHLTKFGTDLAFERDDANRLGAGRPNFTFSNIWDLANDAPRQETGQFDPRTGVPTPVLRELRSAIYGFFVQDDWRLRPSFTLNLGLRVEHFNPISEANDELSNAVLGDGANALTDLRMELGGKLFDATGLNVGPQVGFAWAPNPDEGRLVLRGGFGVGFQKTQGAFQKNAIPNPPFASNVSLQAAEGGVLLAIPDDPNQFFDWPANPAARLDVDSETNLPTTGSQVIEAVEQDADTPTTYRYSVEAQYDLGDRWVATAGYQGSQGRHLTRRRNVGWFVPDNLNPAVTNLFLFTNDGDSTFNALLLGLKRRFTGSFEIDAEYRLAKATDDARNEFDFGDFPFHNDLEDGPADFDVRHNVKLYGIYNLPFFQGEGPVDHLLGGWQVSGILNWHTGFPWTPVFRVPGGGVVFPGDSFTELRPADFRGGAGDATDNDAFMDPTENFPGWRVGVLHDARVRTGHHPATAQRRPQHLPGSVLLWARPLVAEVVQVADHGGVGVWGQHTAPMESVQRFQQPQSAEPHGPRRQRHRQHHQRDGRSKIWPVPSGAGRTRHAPAGEV